MWIATQMCTENVYGKVEVLGESIKLSVISTTHNVLSAAYYLMFEFGGATYTPANTAHTLPRARFVPTVWVRYNV